MNEFAILFAVLLGLIQILGLILAVRNGGLMRHLPYFFSLLIYIQYLLVSPLYFFLNERVYIIGTDISQYYGLGFFFAGISMIAFIVGYWIRSQSVSWSHWKAPAKFTPKVRDLSILFYVLYSAILVNMAIGGINVQNLFLGDEVFGLGARGESYFFQNFADSLITIILIGFLIKVPHRVLWIWVIFSFFIFSLLGFRYRIMLTLFGLLICYISKNRLTTRQYAYGAVLISFFFYITFFLTENRSKLILRQYSEIAYNPADYSFKTFFEQTRGGLADLAIYKLYDNPNQTVDYDYGLSMFGYIFVRMIPRSIYPEKDKFYPPPQNRIIYQAYDAWWGKLSGEATLSPAAFYIAFGWFGLIFGHFFSGLVLRIISDRTVRLDTLSFTTFVIVALVSFQWITRGYFPQIVDHAVYMLIPVWIMKISSKSVKSASKTSPRNRAFHKLD